MFEKPWGPLNWYLTRIFQNLLKASSTNNLSFNYTWTDITYLLILVCKDELGMCVHNSFLLLSFNNVFNVLLWAVICSNLNWGTFWLQIKCLYANDIFRRCLLYHGETLRLNMVIILAMCPSHISSDNGEWRPILKTTYKDAKTFYSNRSYLTALIRVLFAHLLCCDEWVSSDSASYHMLVIFFFSVSLTFI